MPCDPNDITLTQPAFPGIPGLDPLAPFQIGFPDLVLPEGFPEILFDLIDQLFALFPSNIFRPLLGNFSKDVLDAIVSLFNQIAPYLGLYRFFIALLNMIICIINVLCSLPRPARVFRALRQLFRQCLPDFLALFPWLALIAFILALLALLLALLEYLLAKLLELIASIIRNIQIFVNAVGRNDAVSIDAAIRKIASLFCLLENLFSILLALAAIFAIIQSLSEVGVNSVCSSTPQGVDTACCTDDVCPPFIKDSPDGLSGFQGTLVYHRRVTDTTGLVTIRNERWQFADAETGKQFNISDIISGQFNGEIFFPTGIQFSAASNVNDVPYLVDLRFFLTQANLNFFGISGAPRFVRLVDGYVRSTPYLGILAFNQNDPLTTVPSLPPTTGTAPLIAGRIFEDDGTTPIINPANNRQFRLDDFLSAPPINTVPTVEDGVFFNNLEFAFRYNLEGLVTSNVITVGCALTLDRNVVNAAFIDNATPPVNLVTLPDITGGFNCLNAAVQKFRQDVSETGAATFQAEAEACIQKLQDETLVAFEQGVCEGTNPFGSSVELDTDLQFVDLPIEVKVTLRDTAGTPLATNLPAQVQPLIIPKLEFVATLGEVTNVRFDGYDSFVGDLVSDTAGNGTLSVIFNNQTFSDVNNLNNLDADLSITERAIPYTFVASSLTGLGDTAAGRQPGIRRDVDDVARDNTES